MAAEDHRVASAGEANTEGNTEGLAARAPLVGVVMGSSSDWEVMQHAVALLREFDVPFEARVVSAHRTPDDMFDYAARARERFVRD